MQYTYKDYEAIFEYLKSKAIEYSDGQWTDFTDGDFGTIVIHLLSYWGDLMSNQLDLTASELFLNTAEERTSLMEIVKLVGYEPGHFRSSIAFTNIKYIREEGKPYEPYTLPAFTQFYTTDGGLSFYNLNSTTLSDDITTVALYEGVKSSKVFYYDDIDKYGRISLGDYYASTNTVIVNIANGSVTGRLQRVSDVRFTTGELCYSIHVDLDGIPYIQFPTYWANLLSDPTVINVTYLASNGADGRTGANTITRATTSNLSKYQITNPEASVGGYDPETVMEIKAKASIFARTMYSIVTLKDFEDMSIFINDISQVRALDYNNKEEEFPPTIPAYKQPTPPNGVPNDAYKVLIMAVPTDISSQSIFKEPGTTYDNLTEAANQLHELYMERKSATLYVEYRDPIYINPWLTLNVYMDPESLRLSAITEDIVDFLKVRFNRNRVTIGESLYGSVIGKEILNNFPYVDYIEVRDPEYNIEAKPYEFIDITNGFFQLFVNDHLKYVPKGLNLIKMRRGDNLRVKQYNDDGSTTIKDLNWYPIEKYETTPDYIPNSYKYIFNKATGDYPRLDLNKIGVLYDEDNKLLLLCVPDKMLDLGEEQVFTLTENLNYLHIYDYKGISDLVEYSIDTENYNIPSYADIKIEDNNMLIKFPSAYTGVIVKPYEVEINKSITITTPDGSVWGWYNDGVNRPERFNNAIHIQDNIIYVPADWEVDCEGIN